MSQASALTRREQADAGASHILRCAAFKDFGSGKCRECTDGGAALAAAWPVNIYQLSDRDVDNVYLVRAFNAEAAWEWLANNEGLTSEEVKIAFQISEATINEAI